MPYMSQCLFRFLYGAGLCRRHDYSALLIMLGGGVAGSGWDETSWDFLSNVAVVREQPMSRDVSFPLMITTFSVLYLFALGLHYPTFFFAFSVLLQVHFAFADDYA